MSKVQIISIIDMSGSMGALQTEVIGAFNTFIEEQNKLKGKAEVTLVLFDNRYIIPEGFNKVKLKNTPKLTEDIYKPTGMTALYDAIGKTINDFEEYKDVVMLIQTDGEENSSKEFKQSTVKELINKKEAEGWDITFLGANIDAVSVGASIGLIAAKSVQYSFDINGINEAFATMACSTAEYRGSKL